MPATQTVTIKLPALRPLQRELALARRRFNVWVCHRRFGKSVLTLCLLLKDALENPRPQPRYAYIAPLYKQAKAIAWDYCKRLAAQLPDTTTNEAELRLDLPNGARLQLLGADNPDALRGIYLDGVVFDEYAQMVPRVWREIVRPALADRQGWAIWIGTPWGRNHFYDLYTQAPPEADWSTALYRASDTGVIDPTELASAQAQMSVEEYAQEFECAWDAAIPGAYYATELRRMDAERRLTHVPYDPLYEVFTSWDLGVDDSTAIWFVQAVGREIRLIDYYEHHGEGLPHYAKILKEKPYSYAAHYLPHDVDVREFTSGRSRLEVAQKLLPGLIEVVANVPLIDGITATRLLLARTVIDQERCHPGIEALRNYRHAWDEELRAFKDQPRHDWCVTGDTLLLTRYGMYQIMDLPITGEVLTSCGWKAYSHPRITRRNAPLVEVVFDDGYTVRCTPEHLFKTASGWRYAASLSPGTVILSSLIQKPNISTANSIDYGPGSPISPVAGGTSIATSGRWPSALSLLDAISTTWMATPPITLWETWNACPSLNISRKPGNGRKGTGPSIFPPWLKNVLLLGTPPMKDGSGIEDWLNAPEHGKNGGMKTSLVSSVDRSSPCWFAPMAIPRNIAATTAKPLIIAAVNVLKVREDVWCLTVPGGEEFSLANGALVHNSSHGADALRYLALSVDRLGAYEARRRGHGALGQVAYGSTFDPITGGAYAR